MSFPLSVAGKAPLPNHVESFIRSECRAFPASGSWLSALAMYGTNVTGR